MTRGGLAVALMGLALGAGTGEAQDGPTPAPLTLHEAVARGLARNESILVQQEGLIAAEAGVRGARGIYDPVLRLEGGWGRSTEPVNSSFSGAPPGKAAPTNTSTDGLLSVEQRLPTGGLLSLTAVSARQTSDGTFTLLSPAYGSRLGFQLRQPLLVSWSTPGSRIRIASLDRDRAAASLRREVTETVATIERAYWTLSATRREVTVREEAVALAAEQQTQTDVRVEQGVAAEAELAQPKAELERRRGELLASREALARAESALKLLILADDEAAWLVPLATTDDAAADRIPLDVASWMEQALENRPEIEDASATVEQRRLQTALARDRVRPSLDAIFSYERLGLAGDANPAVGPPPGTIDPGLAPGTEGGFRRSFGQIGDGDFSNTRVGFELRIPIRNRTAKADAVIAGAAERQAAALLARTRKQVRADVLDAAAGLETAEQRIAAAAAAREAAQVQLDAERERFAVGLSTNFLVLTRQNELSRARLDEIASLYDYRNARTAVARATGTLLADHGIDVMEGTAGSTRPAEEPASPESGR